MSNLTMFCLTLKPDHLNKIKNFNYLPVGLGEETFSEEWFRDNKGINISDKNKYYGEYTFHYWVWNNYLEKIQDGWIGFCQYRKFWTTEKSDLLPSSFSKLENLVLKKVPETYEKFDVILGEESSVKKLKKMKFLKRGLKLLINKPSYFLNLFDEKKRNIRFHFDMWHGSIYLEKSIPLLDKDDRDDFSNFINSKTSFNPHNMFICKSKKIMQKYYSTLFPWLERCENEFGFSNLSGYGQTRIYGFLAERFMSYWFQKNTNYKTMPILFYDIGNGKV